MFTLKEKNLLLLEQILSFESKPQFGRAMSAREANKKSRKVFPLVKKPEKREGVPLYLQVYGIGTLPCFLPFPQRETTFKTLCLLHWPKFVQKGVKA